MELSKVKYKVGSHGNKKHGMSNSRFYKIYTGIKSRCNNEKVRGYEKYGGRGIEVEWECFEQFNNDMFDEYKKHVEIFGEKETTLDRVDNNKNYSKDNCRWATYKEQARNTRKNRYITYKQETLCLAEWAEQIGITPTLLNWRINISGWSIERALTTGAKKWS